MTGAGNTIVGAIDIYDSDINNAVGLSATTNNGTIALQFLSYANLSIVNLGALDAGTGTIQLIANGLIDNSSNTFIAGEADLTATDSTGYGSGINLTNTAIGELTATSNDGASILPIRVRVR